MAIGDEPIVDIDRTTGELIQGWPRCKQSIIVILTTRLHTRIMRLWWGSEFLGIQDKPGNEQTYFEGIRAASLAINEHEPEFQVTSFLIGGTQVDGVVEVTIEGVYLPDMSRRKISQAL
ncbi:baseplate assembly protein [Methylobacterium ajmalii]|uniref:baseplate assembly protein n=1 Tax=Methylobacterium ajmalii TaxID=2738439 RepID=UPI002F35510D